MKLLILSPLPLLLIFWPNEIGRAVGLGGFRSPVVDQETPGCLVAAAGWFFLFFPTLVYFIQKMQL